MTTPFDAKLEHMLTQFLNAIGADHHIQKTFIHKQILTFEDFTDGFIVETIKTFQRNDSNNNFVHTFTNEKLLVITNVIRYYNFLQGDGQATLAEDPVNWAKADFRIWRQNPPVITTTGAATVTTAAAAAAVLQKEQDDSLLSWRRSSKNEKDYPVLNNDRKFIKWKAKFERKICSDEMYRMIDLTWFTTPLDVGSDTKLYKRQKNFLTTILES